MTESDLRLIETELGITLPEAYRRVMLSYPFEKYASIQNPDFQERMERLLDDPQAVIALNRKWHAQSSGVEDWSSTIFCFGDDGCGLYSLDLASEDPRVFMTHYGYGENYVGGTADFLDEWVAEQISLLNEHTEKLRRREEKRRNKHWLQFWI